MTAPPNTLPTKQIPSSSSDADGNELHRCSGNHQTINRIRLGESVSTKAISIFMPIEVTHPSDQVAATLFGVQGYDFHRFPERRDA